MTKKRFILISCAIVLGAIWCLVFYRFILPEIDKFKDDYQAFEKHSHVMTKFRWDILRYLDIYYDEHQCYPNHIDIKKIDTFENPDYTKIFERATYQSNGDSYEFTSIRPNYIDFQIDEKTEYVLIDYGVKGERQDPNSYVIDKKTGKRVVE